LIRPKRKKPAILILAWAAAAALASLAVAAQNVTPPPAVSPSGQTDPTSLPDGPLPVPAPARTPLPAPLKKLPPAREAAQAPVTLNEETLLRVLTNEAVNSRQAKDGAPLTFTVSEDVLAGDVLAIPAGATVHGAVVRSRKAGVLTGSPELTLKLVSLDLGGRSYPLYSYQFKVRGTSKTRPTESKALRGAYAGAIVGAFVGGVSSKGVVATNGTNRAVNMTAAAALGAGVGTAVSAATPGPAIWIPAESQVDFYLAAPITVTPVSAQEAAQLGQGLHSGGPVLYLRGETP